MDISTSKFLQFGYGVGHILNDVCASLWFTYLLVFYHLVLGFSASQSGNLMLIGQVVDALSTPFVGYHSDRTDNDISAKYGKRKLWHLFGTACVLGSFPFIFSHCLNCELSHKWAQMFYFASFIMIFQIGWASVQISHLSMIPELADDEHSRSHLTAVRFGFTVFSNIFVYVVTWIVLHISGDCDKQQIGPGDAWKFRNIVLIVMAVGIAASLLFHIVVRERRQYRTDQINYNSNTHCDFLRKPALYQIAGIYMSTRLVVNVSQVFVPLYLHKTLGLPARSLAVVPLAMYLGSLIAAGVQRLSPRRVTRKGHYLIGSIFTLISCVWIFVDSGTVYKEYFIYVVGVLIGFGGAVMLVTSLSLTADLVGARTEASAFVYGLMSFTDKLACGVAIALIQKYADAAGTEYYREILVWLCGAATVVGLILTLALPRLNTTSLVVNDAIPPNADETTTLLGPNNTHRDIFT